MSVKKKLILPVAVTTIELLKGLQCRFEVCNDVRNCLYTDRDLKERG